MNFDYTIRILDPFGGWGVHSSFYKIQNNINIKNSHLEGNLDTGLCNRLFHWEVFYDILDNANQFSSTLAVQSCIWPELHLIHLPETVVVSYNMHNSNWYNHFNHDNMYFKTVFDVKNDTISSAKKLTHDEIKSMYKDNNFKLFKSHNHWYTDYGYFPLNRIYEGINKSDNFNKLHNRPINKIKILDDKIDRKIKLESALKIGIHIRRGNGVMVTEDDIKTFPLEIQDEYREYITNHTKTLAGYEFNRDSMYFDFIDSILEVNPNQKFYISHDLPDKFMNHYYERYGNIISTKKDNREYYLNYYSSKLKNLNNLISYANIIDNVVDLFSLSNCGYLVKSNTSSWSEFAEIYKQKKSNSIRTISKKLKDDKDNFIQQVLEFRKTIKII